MKHSRIVASRRDMLRTGMVVIPGAFLFQEATQRGPLVVPPYKVKIGDADCDRWFDSCPVVRWPDINAVTTEHLTEARDAVTKLHAGMLAGKPEGFGKTAKLLRSAFAAMDGAGITDVLEQRIKGAEYREFTIPDVAQLHSAAKLSGMGITVDELEKILRLPNGDDMKAGFARLKQDGGLQFFQNQLLELLERADHTVQLQTAQWRRDLCWALDQSVYVLGATMFFTIEMPPVAGIFGGFAAVFEGIHHNAC